MKGKRQKHLFVKEFMKAYEYAGSPLLCPPIGGYKSQEHKEQLRRDYAMKLATRNFVLALA